MNAYKYEGFFEIYQVKSAKAGLVEINQLISKRSEYHFDLATALFLDEIHEGNYIDKTYFSSDHSLLNMAS